MKELEPSPMLKQWKARMIVLKFVFDFNLLKKVIFSFFLAVFFIQGICSTPVAHLKIEDSINKLIEKGEFRKAGFLFSLDSVIQNEDRIVASILNSYRFNESKLVDSFVYDLLRRDSLKYLKSNKIISNLIYKTIQSEIYIYSRLLEILLENRKKKTDFFIDGVPVVFHAAGDLDIFFEKSEFEYRFNFSSVRLLELLKKYNFKFDLVDKNGITPLMVSSFFGDDKAVSFFLRNGANKKNMIKNGKWSGFGGIDLAKHSLFRLEKGKKYFKFNQKFFLIKKIESYKKVISLLSNVDEREI